MGEASGDYNKAFREYFVVLGMFDFRSFPHRSSPQVTKGEGGIPEERVRPLGHSLGTAKGW